MKKRNKHCANLLLASVFTHSNNFHFFNILSTNLFARFKSIFLYPFEILIFNSVFTLLRIRISKGYKNIDLTLADELMNKMLREMKII